MHSCAINCTWADWEEWGSCSTVGERTCGKGTAYRSRTKTGPFHGGSDCEGSDTDSVQCYGSKWSCPSPKTIEFDPNHWGGSDWGDTEYCGNQAYRDYAIGFYARIKPYKKGWYNYDNLGVTSFRLLCEKNQFIYSKQMPYGDWIGPGSNRHEKCWNGLYAFSVKYQNWIGDNGDDTAINDIKMGGRKSNGYWKWLEINSKYMPAIHPDSRGRWGGVCPSGFVICGLQTRVNRNGADWSGLNGIKFKCCKNIWFSL